MDFRSVTFLWVFYGSKEAQRAGIVAEQKRGRVVKSIVPAAEHP